MSALAWRFTGMRAVLRREFHGYFASPLGYIFMVIFLIASGYLMVSRDFGRFLELREANLDALFSYLPWIFVVLVPAVAMRLWAEERRSGAVLLAIGLLFSALSKNQVVAFILAVAASVGFLLIGVPQTQEFVGKWFGGYVERVVSSLSLLDHFETLTRGLLQLNSLLFFVLFTVGWLVCGMLVLSQTKTN